MPPGLPNHETNTTPSSVPPWIQGLSGALWIMRTSDQVAPLSVEVISLMLPEVPLLLRYCWHTA